jgi:Winged helix DNA-binding domain
MTTTPTVDRAQVLAYRVAAQDLDRPVAEADRLGVVGLGVQDTPPGSALLALLARTAPAASAGLEGRLRGGGPLALVLGARGAPHVHRAADLGLLTAALRPVDTADTVARVGGFGPGLQSSGIDGLAALDEVVAAMRAVVGGRPVSKPDLSTALNERVDERLRPWCERCRSAHVADALFRMAALPAGLRLDPDQTAPVVFLPPDPGQARGVPDPARARAELVRRYLRVLGPATPADLAGWLGTTPAVARGALDLVAGELAAVKVDGRLGWLLERDLDALRAAPAPAGVRLLPPNDPYLASDRDLLAGDRDLRRRVWRSVGAPGVVLVRGELAGTWRHRRAGRRLAVTVTLARRLPAADRRLLAAEADGVAAARGLNRADLQVEEG